MVRNENQTATEVRIADDITLLRADPTSTELAALTPGIHQLRAVNDERAVVLLVVKEGRLEIWVRP